MIWVGIWVPGYINIKATKYENHPQVSDDADMKHIKELIRTSVNYSYFVAIMEKLKQILPKFWRLIRPLMKPVHKHAELGFI